MCPSALGVALLERTRALWAVFGDLLASLRVIVCRVCVCAFGHVWWEFGAPRASRPLGVFTFTAAGSLSDVGRLLMDRLVISDFGE